MIFPVIGSRTGTVSGIKSLLWRRPHLLSQINACSITTMALLYEWAHLVNGSILLATTYECVPHLSRRTVTIEWQGHEYKKQWTLFPNPHSSLNSLWCLGSSTAFLSLMCSSVLVWAFFSVGQCLPSMLRTWHSILSTSKTGEIKPSGPE